MRRCTAPLGAHQRSAPQRMQLQLLSLRAGRPGAAGRRNLQAQKLQRARLCGVRRHLCRAAASAASPQAGPPAQADAPGAAARPTTAAKRRAAAQPAPSPPKGAPAPRAHRRRAAAASRRATRVSSARRRRGRSRAPRLHSWRQAHGHGGGVDGPAKRTGRRKQAEQACLQQTQVWLAGAVAVQEARPDRLHERGALLQ